MSSPPISPATPPSPDAFGLSPLTLDSWSDEEEDKNNGIEVVPLFRGQPGGSSSLQGRVISPASNASQAALFIPLLPEVRPAADAGPLAKDLDFVWETILADHPGVGDSTFMEVFNQQCAIAKRAFQEDRTEVGRMRILSQFGKNFNDSHLKVRYSSLEQNAPAPISKPIQITCIRDDVYWIDLPTFSSSNDQEIIEQISKLRDKTLVFNLQGNGGGNSSLGVRLLEAVFGAEYAQLRLQEESSQEVVLWRATPGNLKHVETFVTYLETLDGDHSEAIGWAQRIEDGVRAALMDKATYFEERTERPDPHLFTEHRSLFKGKIFVVMDKGCSGSTLDFIDGLQWMGAPVLIGQTTGADSCYMEVRRVDLPSGKGQLALPIKKCIGKMRKPNVPYQPLLKCGLSDQTKVQQFIFDILSPDVLLPECS